MNIVLLGPPGAGKGTQAERISAACGLPQVSTGDIFRKNLAEGTPLGLEAKKYMDSGELVPDEVVEGIVADRLSEPDVSGGFILDGFPRSMHQARALDEYLEADGRAIDLVLNIAVEGELLVKRLTGRRTCRDCAGIFHVQGDPEAASGVCGSCGGELYQRADDNEETVRNRLEVYARQTEPVIGYYAPGGSLVSVDGSGSVDEVFSRITSAVERAKAGGPA